MAGGDSLKASKRDRWQMHCVAAAKQSGLNTLPTLGQIQPLAAYLATPARGLRLFGDLDEAASLREALATSPAPESIELLVGPEGGFTDEERAAILASGATPIRLGETTLRTETAAIALLAGVRAVCNYLVHGEIQRKATASHGGCTAAATVLVLEPILWEPFPVKGVLPHNAFDGGGCGYTNQKGILP